MATTRIMIVDDHAVLRAGLRLLINAQSDMEVVAEADKGSAALEQAIACRPELVLLDLTLPEGASLPLIVQLRNLLPEGHVLVLTMHSDPAYVRAALGAGAMGYLVKTVSEQQLLSAIRQVRRGKLMVDLDNAELNASVFQRHISASSATTSAQLSVRETQVLEMLGRGLSNHAIAAELEVSSKTVATYRARIGEKLGLKTTAEFVKYAIDNGLTRPDR